MIELSAPLGCLLADGEGKAGCVFTVLFLKTLFCKNTVIIKQILQSWPFVMFPQCPHPVASYTFDLTCRYLTNNKKRYFLCKCYYLQWQPTPCLNTCPY